MRLSVNVLCNLKTVTKSLLQRSEKEIFIEAPWGKLAALTWGNPSNPPVLLCHGRMDVCSSFRPLVFSLPDCFYYVSVDLPGNGKSDSLPPGVKLSVMDLVPTVEEVRKYFKWDKFAFMGHSLGTLIGKFFILAYPDAVTRSVELDPIPAYVTCTVEDLGHWYRYLYEEYYGAKGYKKFNSGTENAPKHNYEKALNLMMNTRGLTKEGAEHVLERSLEPAGDGLFRFNYDRRLKDITILPFTGDYLKHIFTPVKTPIFAVLSDTSIGQGFYDSVPFVKDESLWPNKNYTFKIVHGSHDVHIHDPGCMSEEISRFLLQDVEIKS